MYNDDRNLYHHSYNHGGSEPGQREILRAAPAGPEIPVREMKPSKKKRAGLKIAALALSCALLGGAAGGAAVWGFEHRPGSTEIAQSNRPVTQVALHTVDGKNRLSDAEVYAANVNSVVSINTSVNAGYNYFGQPVENASAGSGFILTRDGYIVTNYHVVKNANTIKVNLYNGDAYDATFINGDEDYDIAVIKVEASDLQAVTLGDSSKLNVGDRVLAIGNPLGELTFSMTGGMVSCVDRAINVDGTPFNMIQTDASINPGNSGGPLFNEYGEVVGIVSAKYSASSNGTSAEGLGFAIPMNDVFAMIKDIMTNGYVTNKPYLGITPQNLTENMAAMYRYDISSGVFVCSVEDGSAAAKAGLQMGDVITKVDNTKITSVDDLNAAKKKYSAGDTSSLEIYRNGETINADITWGATPVENQAAAQQQQQQNQNQNNQNQPQNPYGNGYNPFEDFFRYFYGGSY